MPMTLAGEVHLAGVRDHDEANEDLRNLSVPYVPLGGGVDGGTKSHSGFVSFRKPLKPRPLTLPAPHLDSCAQYQACWAKMPDGATPGVWYPENASAYQLVERVILNILHVQTRASNTTPFPLTQT